MPAALEDPPVFGASLATGVATAELQPDGSVIVRDVPLFAEIFPTDPGALDGMRTPRDRAWLERAVAKTQARIAGGYNPPMTLRHHYDEPERTGTFVPKRVATAVVNPGEAPRATVFGDKVYASREAFERSKDHDYRSVEISPDDPEEFSALALLKDKAPFFKFPSLVERLEPSARDPFVRDAFKARAGVAPQLWANRTEVFGAAYEGARDPRAVVSAILAKTATHESKKEGDMPADTKDKAPSIEERMEACLARFEEKMMKTFEDRLSKVAGVKDDKGEKAETAKEATAKAGGTEEPSGKKPESAEASRGPDPVPAVSQARPGEVHGARNGGEHLPRDAGQVPEAFAARVATLEQANMGLRAAVDRMEREKAAVHHVAQAKRALVDMGVPSVTEAFEARLHKAATEGGEKGVSALLEDVKLAMGLQARAPEAYGSAAPSANGAPPVTAFDADVKKAIEVYGQRPEVRTRIMDLAAQFRSEGETFVRSLEPGAFFKNCQGRPEINPSIMEARGGFRRGV